MEADHAKASAKFFLSAKGRRSRPRNERLSLEEAMAEKDARDREIFEWASSATTPSTVKISTISTPSALQPHHCKPPHAPERIAGRVYDNTRLFGARKEDHRGQRHPSGLRRPATSSRELRQAGTAPTPSTRNLTTGRVSVNANCKPSHDALELAGCVSVNANCKPPHDAQELAGSVSVNANCKPLHAAQELAGRVSVNANCKPPHAAQELAGRVSVNANCKPPHAAEE